MVLPYTHRLLLLNRKPPLPSLHSSNTRFVSATIDLSPKGIKPHCLHGGQTPEFLVYMQPHSLGGGSGKELVNSQQNKYINKKHYLDPPFPLVPAPAGRKHSSGSGAEVCVSDGHSAKCSSCWVRGRVGKRM